jgi:hypothetical protein
MLSFWQIKAGMLLVLAAFVAMGTTNEYAAGPHIPPHLPTKGQIKHELDIIVRGADVAQDFSTGATPREILLTLHPQWPTGSFIRSQESVFPGTFFAPTIPQGPIDRICVERFYLADL